MGASDLFGLVGHVLDGHIRVEQAMGASASGTVVYRGYHEGLGQPVAITCISVRESPASGALHGWVQRLGEQSHVLNRLAVGNPHVVRILACGTAVAADEQGFVPYLVFEWLNGCTLQEELAKRREHGRSEHSIASMLELLTPAVDALRHAHSQGIAHANLHPGSFFIVNESTGTKTIKVRGFCDVALGLCPQVNITYSAPEQLEPRLGPTGAHSDVYTFALIALEVLLGRPVFDVAQTEDFATRRYDPAFRPTPRTFGIHVSDDIEAVFAAATVWNPSDRLPTVDAFWVALCQAHAASVPQLVIGPDSLTQTANRPSVESARPNHDKLTESTSDAVTSSSHGLAQSTESSEHRLGAAVYVAGKRVSVNHIIVLCSMMALSGTVLAGVSLWARSSRENSVSRGESGLRHVVRDEPDAQSRDAPKPVEPAPMEPPTSSALDVAGADASAAPRTTTGSLDADAGRPSDAPKTPLPTTDAVARPATQAPPPATPASSPPVVRSQSDPHAFNETLAKQRLSIVNGVLVFCKRSGGITGPGNAQVTFGSDGGVVRVVIEPPYVGTKEGECIDKQFRRAKVAPFSGMPQTVYYTFEIPR